MSIDASLKTKGALDTHRSVLKRHERLEKMQATKGFDPEKKPVIGIAKTLNKRIGR